LSREYNKKEGRLGLKKFVAVTIGLVLLFLLIQGGMGIKADGGWQKVSDVSYPVNYYPYSIPVTLTGFLIDPLNPDHLVVTSFYGGVLKQSFDGGKNWSDVRVNKEMNILTTNLYWVDGTWYFNSWGRIYKTQDFKEFETVLDLPGGCIDSFWTDGTTFYVGLRPGDKSENSCFYKSIDGGKTLQNLSSSIRQAVGEDYPYFLGVNRITVFKGLVITNDFKMKGEKETSDPYINFDTPYPFISFDGGLGFQKLNFTYTQVFIVGDYLWVESWDPSTKSITIYQSKDGINWEMVTDKLPCGFWNVSYDKNTGIIFGVNGGEGIYYSSDNGKTWLSYNQGFTKGDFHGSPTPYGDSILRIYNGKLYLVMNGGFYMNSLPSKKSVIILQVDNPYMTVNGLKQEIDPGRGTTPVIIKEWGRTVVPIRAIVEALGGTIDWDGNMRKVTINFKDTTIELWIDNPKAKVDGKETWIDSDNHNVKPIIQNSRTMLPLRFVAESLGCSVDWNSTTKTITIKYPKEG